MATPDLKRAAQTWADRGWPVFPCAPSKRPATLNGFHDATRDAERIDAWTWQMIGGVPGSAGYVVLDIDKQAGAGPNDLPDLECWETRRHRTRSGGWHLIFKARPGAVYGNGPRADIGRGIDIRHNDGYVILPPSAGYSLDNDAEPLDAPAWLELPKSVTGIGQAPAAGGAIPRGQQDTELRNLANRLYQAGADELAVREAIRSTIATRCIDQDPRNPFQEADIIRLARPAPDTLLGQINRGELDAQPEPPKLDDVLDTAALLNMPPTEWLIDKVLPEGFNVLYGPSGSYKSFAALDIACTVASGNGEWYGNSVKSGRVVYVLGEGAGGMAKRLKAWGRVLDATDLANLPNITWVRRPVNLTDDSQMRWLSEAITATGDAPLLVIFDTLAQCMAGGEENSATEMGKAIEACARLRLRFGCSVLALHHTGWDTSRERGSSALRAAADSTLSAEKSEDGGDRSLTLKSVKMRDDEAFAPLYFGMVKDNGSLRLEQRDSAPETSAGLGWLLDVWPEGSDDQTINRSTAGLRMDIDVTKDRGTPGKRMERLVSMGYCSSEEPSPNRYIYRLTEAGREALRTARRGTESVNE